MNQHEAEADAAAVDPHAAVTNEAPAGADAGPQAAPIIDDAEPGAGEAAPTEGELESVAGYLPRAESGAMFESSFGAAAPMPMLAPNTAGLLDIGEASFGPPMSLETVHGRDDRVQVGNTAIYPWRAIASLMITAADNSQWIGTAWFIGPKTLVTAGHCVFIKNSGVPGRDGWVKRIVVMPGRNGAAMPHGSVTATVFRSVKGWTQNGNAEYDYGAIILPNLLGNATGWFGYGSYSDGDLTGKTLNIAGYPGDKPSGTMWFGSNKVASLGARKVFYDIDTAGGQSGAPVWRLIDGKRYGVAIHAYGGAVTNSGTRISKPVFDNLKAWKA